MPSEETPDRLGPYEIQGELGRGGMGAVYRAYRPSLKRHFAVKVIRPGKDITPDGVARFLREGQAAAQLASHPGIVGVHDIGESEGRVYLAMDLVEGTALDTKLEDGIVAPVEAAGWVEQAARAIHFAHAHGVLHRDVKPGNLLLTPEGDVRVTDFGLAGHLEPDADGVQLTQSGDTVGTASYMSPEQALAEPLDERADVYALGATLYECLAGRPPFTGASVMNVLSKLTTQEPVAVRKRRADVPRDLETIVMKCLEKERERRYPTAGALAEDLARFTAGEPIAARPVGAAERWVRRVRRNPVAAAALGLALLAVVAAGAVSWTRHVREQAGVQAAFDSAVSLIGDSPQEALGLLQSVRQRAPDHPGLERAIARARARVDARALEAREAEAARFLAHGDEARQLFEESPVPRERNAAWQQAWGFYMAARGVVAQHADSAARADAEDRLAALAWVRLQAAEAAGADADAAHYLDLLSRHGATRYERELRGDGTLTLTTDPPGAAVECRRYEDADGDGRLEERLVAALGVTPLAQTPLPMGSYLLVLRRDGFRPVRYPVLVERLESVHAGEPVRLLTESQIGTPWCYIPAGRVVRGGDLQVHEAGARRRERVPGFLLRRTEVTMAEYHAFLTDLLAKGESAAAVTARCPRSDPDSGHLWVVDDRRALPVLGERLPPDWPVFGVSWDDARAFCAWASQRAGRPVRLPTQAEWVRAARGADARPLPWGRRFRWEWTVGALSPMHAADAQPLAVTTARVDVSPFGVHDLAGSVAEWCADELPDRQRAIRGGAWVGRRPVLFRATSAFIESPSMPSMSTGFRLVADLPPK
ncbi:MAG: protein kinase domain-containing protein [Planctomycetota bacterium]